MTPLTPWERILMVIEYSGCKSVSEFARKIGLNRSENLFQIKRGNNGISLKLAETISAKYSYFSIGWLMIGEGEPSEDGGVEPEFHTIPYYTNFSKNSIGEIPEGTIPISRNFFPDADYATIIKNDWLEPRIPAGSLILLKNSRQIIYGNNYYIELYTGHSLFRIIRKSDIYGFVGLTSNNPAYDDIEIPEKEILTSFMITGIIVTI